MTRIVWLKRACEYVGGERDDPPPGVPVSIRSPYWGLGWGILALLIAAFCGQSSKFIYIDF